MWVLFLETGDEEPECLAAYEDGRAAYEMRDRLNCAIRAYKAATDALWKRWSELSDVEKVQEQRAFLAEEVLLADEEFAQFSSEPWYCETLAVHDCAQVQQVVFIPKGPRNA